MQLGIDIESHTIRYRIQLVIRTSSNMEAYKSEFSVNPREKANLLSKLLLSWTIPMFMRGYRKTIELKDIFSPLDAYRSQPLGDRLEK